MRRHRVYGIGFVVGAAAGVGFGWSIGVPTPPAEVATASAGQPPPAPPNLPAPKADPPVPAVGVPVPEVPSHFTPVPPLPAPPPGARVQYVNTKRIAVDYEVTRKAASGLRRVELWLAGEKEWGRAATANPGEPLEVELAADGAYGLKVVPVSGEGASGAAPSRETAPDWWIVLDTKRPESKFSVVVAESPDGMPPAPFVVEATVTDANLDPAGVVFEYRLPDSPSKNPTQPLFTGADATKPKIETKIGTFVPRQPRAWSDRSVLTLTFDWTPAPGLGSRAEVVVSPIDKAGNKGNGWLAVVHLDLPRPAARVTDVRAVSGK